LALGWVMELHGFNGATPFQAWKHQGVLQRGRQAMAGFNGATPFQAWKLVHANDIAIKSPELQWGHAFSGVETEHSA